MSSPERDMAWRQCPEHALETLMAPRCSGNYEQNQEHKLSKQTRHKIKIKMTKNERKCLRDKGEWSSVSTQPGEKERDFKEL